MKGPRVFAFVVLLALALLPKTGWIVRNQIDVLRGGWGTDAQFPGLFPLWAFQRRNLQDPLARAIRPEIGQDGATYQGTWASYGAILRDPVLGVRARGILLRRGLTAGVPAEQGPEPPEKRAFVRQNLLPLALQGEAADRDNAFYPLTAWGLYLVLGQTEDAAAALARAARCSRYDDATFAEPELFREGFERQYGYRGSQLRLSEAFSVLLPNFAATQQAARIVLAKAAPNDPARRDLVRVGATMVRTSPTLLGMTVGRNLILQAIGAQRPRSYLDLGKTFERAPGAYAAFRAANPEFRDAGELELAQKVRDLEPTVVPYLEGIAATIVTPVGSALLLALVGGLALAWPARRAERTDFEGRLRRASWAWLGLIPAAFYDGRPVVYLPMFLAAALSVALARRGTRRAGLVLGALLVFAGLALAAEGWVVASLVWTAALVLPARKRPFAWGAALLGIGGTTVFLWFRAPSLEPALAAGLFFLPLPLALPLQRDERGRRGGEWLTAGLALLYLGGVAVELRADAQTAEVVRQFQREAPRLRSERGI